MNILSIDFDWIMEPSIEAYNEHVGIHNYGADYSWKYINKIMPGIDFKCDLQKYYILFCIINNFNNEGFLIKHHHDMYDIIKSNVNSSTPIHIYNIDHHHDLGYPNENNNIVRVGNWMSHLGKDYENIDYTWINNKNSLNPSKDMIDCFNNFYRTSDVSIIDAVQFDKLFLCPSWEWTPPKYEPLFNTLATLIDKN